MTTVEKKQFSLSQNKGTKYQILVTSHRHPQNETSTKVKFFLIYFLLPVIEDNETYPPAKKWKPQ